MRELKAFVWQDGDETIDLRDWALKAIAEGFCICDKVDDGQCPVCWADDMNKSDLYDQGYDQGYDEAKTALEPFLDPDKVERLSA